MWHPKGWHHIHPVPRRRVGPLVVPPHCTLQAVSRDCVSHDSGSSLSAASLCSNMTWQATCTGDQQQHVVDSTTSLQKPLWCADGLWQCRVHRVALNTLSTWGAHHDSLVTRLILLSSQCTHLSGKQTVLASDMARLRCIADNRVTAGLDGVCNTNLPSNKQTCLASYMSAKGMSTGPWRKLCIHMLCVILTLYG